MSKPREELTADDIAAYRGYYGLDDEQTALYLPSKTAPDIAALFAEMLRLDTAQRYDRPASDVVVEMIDDLLGDFVEPFDPEAPNRWRTIAALSLREAIRARLKAGGA